MIRLLSCAVAAATLGLGAGPATAAGETVLSEMTAICLDTGGDHARAEAVARARGYADAEGGKGDFVAALTRMTDNGPFVVILARDTMAAGPETPSQVLAGCMVGGPDADESSAKAMRNWVSAPLTWSEEAPERSSQYFVERGGKRVGLPDSEDPTLVKALKEGGYWVLAVDSTEDRSFLVLARSTLAK